MPGDSFHRVDTRRRRLGYLAHASHVDSAQILGERCGLPFIDVENFERAREAFETGDLDSVYPGALGEYLRVNRRVRLREFFPIEALSERRLQRWIEQGSGAANFASAELHERQRVGIPGD